MKLSWWLPLSVLCVCVSAKSPSSSGNTTSPTPICVSKCFSNIVLREARCDVNQIAPCLCLDVPLQHRLSTCVQKDCNYNEQASEKKMHPRQRYGSPINVLVALDEQSKICAGYPQESRKAYIMRVGIIFFVITMIVLGCRLFTRYSNTGKLWADDWVALVAGICLVIVASLQIYVCSLGFGKHMWQIPLNEGLQLVKPFYALQFLYIAVQVLAKISLLLVYQRIYPSSKFQRICTWGIAFVAMHGVAFTFTILFQCRPIESSWNPNINKKCLSAPAIGFAGAGFSIVEDLVIIILPLPQLLRLQVKTAQKIALIFMFSIGSFACITSIVRLKYLSAFENSTDLTWENTDILVWSILEIEVTVICACLPTLRPLFVEIIPGTFRTTKTESSNSKINNIDTTSKPEFFKSKYNLYPWNWLRRKNNPRSEMEELPVIEKSWSSVPE
ncbi:putative integral membrane protein [Erysiphe neolycopersici]|uniref:Putative integral membrane protein n=1 Tax=Erysiphe neolycopersici TaxID=212602 RepID=A0A420I4N4_9PEZI|nr:putative integral membrane protein [Erysiphe neolycopersici]